MARRVFRRAWHAKIRKRGSPRHHVDGARLGIRRCPAQRSLMLKMARSRKRSALRVVREQPPPSVGSGLFAGSWSPKPRIDPLQYWSEHRVSLPCSPELPQVDLENVYRLAPYLKGLPLGPIKKAIHRLSHEFRLWGRVAQVSGEPPVRILRKELEVVVDDSCLSTTPTHYLAVYQSLGVASRKKCRPRRMVDIIPAHAFILATYCRNLRPIPRPRRAVHATKSPHAGHPILATAAPETDGDLYALRLPLLHIPVPHPSTFEVLLQYFYTGNQKALSLNLIPYFPPWTNSLSDRAYIDPALDGDSGRRWKAKWVVELATQFTPPQLHQFARKVWSVWWNMVALGVADRHIWGVVKFQMSLCHEAAAAQQCQVFRTTRNL